MILDAPVCSRFGNAFGISSPEGMEKKERDRTLAIRSRDGFGASGERYFNCRTVCRKPVICTYWKKGVPGGSRLTSRKAVLNTQFRVGGE